MRLVFKPTDFKWSARQWGFRALLSCAAVATLVQVAHAQLSYPMLMSIRPVAVQAGATTEIEISSRYSMYGANQILISGSGVTAQVIPPEVKEGEPVPATPPEQTKVKVSVTATSDALPGVRDIRVVTPRGVSTVGQLVIARDPIVAEAADNDTLATAQAVSLPATLCGSLEKAEDVDNFKFTLAGPTALVFHVRSARLQDRIHDLQIHSDPILTIKNAAGSVLAASDNFFFGDPLLHFAFPAAGEYFLEIRDVRYQGNADWTYCIESSDRPMVTQVYPPRVTPGVETSLKLVGFNLAADATATVNVPADTVDGLHWLPLMLNGQATNPAPIWVSRLPEQLEATSEINPDNNTAATAQAISVPAGISGRIESEADLDCYAFDAKAGQAFTFEIMARRGQSALDPLLRLRNAEGALLAEQDDIYNGRHSFADSMYETWSAPADGRYVLEVSDLHLRGGESFVYFLKCTPAQPHFRLETDTDKTLLSPGSNGVVFVRAHRRNGFAGEIQLAAEGLPAGVTAHCGRILASGVEGCIVFSTTAETPMGVANIRITGSASHALPDGQMMTFNEVAAPMQEIYLPGGGRGHYPVEMQTVSVGEMMDIKAVTLSTYAVTLKPGESQRIDVSIERRPEYKGNVTLDTIMQHLEQNYGTSLPAGVKIDDSASQLLLSADQAQGYITLKAAPDAAPVEAQQTAIMANVSINFVMKYSYSSAPLMVTVAKP